MPVVSIVIPAYNASRFIRQCIDSILDQDFYDWELIIVDDGSTDNTKIICEEYVSSNRKIFLKTQANKGVAAARNNGMRIASGEFIMFIDADDLLPRNSLRTFNEALERNPSIDLLRGEYVAVDAHGNKIFTSNKKVFDKSRLYVQNDINIFYSKYIKAEYFLWLMWIRRSCINVSQFKEGQIYMEDARFLFEVTRNIHNCIYIPSEIYYYRKYSEAATALLNAKKIEDIVSLSLFLNDMRTEMGCFTANTLKNAITDCWDIIFNYIISVESGGRAHLIKELGLQYKAWKCISEIGATSSDMKDFVNNDVDAFIKNYKKRQIVRRVMDQVPRIASYLKGRLWLK